jgi:hypothetical protein
MNAHCDERKSVFVALRKAMTVNRDASVIVIVILTTTTQTFEQQPGASANASRIRRVLGRRG